MTGSGGVLPFPGMFAIVISQQPDHHDPGRRSASSSRRQITCNCYIGMTRVMVGMSLDRTLPEMVSQGRTAFRSPVNAHVIYFVACLPVIWLYNNFAYGDGDGLPRGPR